MNQYELPNRDDLVGKEVRITRHWWASAGPRKGIFLGQGERGLSIRVKGGGRHMYRHSEVKSIKPVRSQPAE